MHFRYIIMKCSKNVHEHMGLPNNTLLSTRKETQTYSVLYTCLSKSFLDKNVHVKQLKPLERPLYPPHCYKPLRKWWMLWLGVIIRNTLTLHNYHVCKTIRHFNARTGLVAMETYCVNSYCFSHPKTCKVDFWRDTGLKVAFQIALKRSWEIAHVQIESYFRRVY